MANNTTRIAEIDAILRSGVRAFTNDGTTITHDFAELRRERRRLIESDDTLSGKRPPIAVLDLGSF
jgi:hypothetical protein